MESGRDGLLHDTILTLVTTYFTLGRLIASIGLPRPLCCVRQEPLLCVALALSFAKLVRAPPLFYFPSFRVPFFFTSLPWFLFSSFLSLLLLLLFLHFTNYSWKISDRKYRQADRQTEPNPSIHPSISFLDRPSTPPLTDLSTPPP